MSSSYVRQLFRQWCNEIATAENLPFYDTVNRHQEPTDDVWFTAAFQSETHEGTFCSPQFVENGFINVFFVARPGIGDVPCLVAVERIIPLLFARSDAKLSLINYEPVEESTFGSADKDYRMSVAINYKLSL